MATATHRPGTRAGSSRIVIRTAVVLAFFLSSGAAWTGPAEEHLPADLMASGRAIEQPVPNAAFVPGADAVRAEPLHLRIDIAQVEMVLNRQLAQPVCDGKPVEMGGSCRDGTDKRLFPAISLELFSFDDDMRLGAAEVGTMIAETEAGTGAASYWHVIPQYGRVWQEPRDDGWSRAAFPLMLVHDFENVAHQGLVTFLYRGESVTDLRFQFVQQSTPWNTPEHFIAWGTTQLQASAVNNPDSLKKMRDAAVSELKERLEARRWSELEAQYPDGALDGFGGPLGDEWVVMHAAVKDSVIYYKDSVTPYGPFPYPHDMRFGIRSMTKSISVPLALGRLAQAYGPYVLNLRIGDYVDGLHPGYDAVRFIDAANMATGMGGAGVMTTIPNDGGSGYVDSTYDDWYNGAPSAADKVAAITRDTGPYPWGPGVVHRYRDRDHHLLGMASDGFVKAMRGPNAGIWSLLEEEVFRPIGIHHAPIVKTKEPDGSPGFAWFHAGYYPTLDDLAKIVTLFRDLGRHGDNQVLHAGVAAAIFTTDGAIIKDLDHSLDTALAEPADPRRYEGKELYKLGFHYTPYIDADGTARHVPMMAGFSATTAILHPGEIIPIRFAKAWPIPPEQMREAFGDNTLEILNNLPKSSSESSKESDK